MNGFEYKYHTPNDILNNILLISEISPLDVGLFWFVFILILWFQLHIIPAINIVVANAIKQYESNKRRNFIKQIAIQKDIEDQISEEIDVH
jgi:hypothetical protein